MILLIGGFLILAALLVEALRYLRFLDRLLHEHLGAQDTKLTELGCRTTELHRALVPAKDPPQL